MDQGQEPSQLDYVFTKCDNEIKYMAGFLMQKHRSTLIQLCSISSLQQVDYLETGKMRMSYQFIRMGVGQR